MASVATIDLVILHALPGRLRVHLPDRTARELEQIARELRALPAVWRVRANGLTGNLLVEFDPGAADAVRIGERIGLADRARAAAATTPPQAAPTRAAGSRRPRDPARLFWPIVHLIFAASPIGIALHVGEVAWEAWPLLRPEEATEPEEAPRPAARRRPLPRVTTRSAVAAHQTRGVAARAVRPAWGTRSVDEPAVATERVAIPAHADSRTIPLDGLDRLERTVILARPAAPRPFPVVERELARRSA